MTSPSTPPEGSTSARARDVPGPRENPSAAAPLLGRVLAGPYRAVLAALHRLRVRPWHLTLASLAFVVAGAAALIRGDRVVAGMLIILSGMCDVFDGGLARLRGEQRRSGAFLDSVVDRASDMVLFGSLFWALASEGERLDAGLALATLLISLLVSQLRAEAEAAGASLSEGIFQRLERVLVIFLGLVIPGALRPALVLLATLGAVTVIQRCWSGWRRLAGMGLRGSEPRA